MPNRPGDPEFDAALGTTEPGLADPSSLLSPSWPRDNLLTAQPAELYDGKIRTLVSQRSLPLVFDALKNELGPFTPEDVVPGAYAWRVRCESDAGPFTLEIPLAVDDPGQRDRRRVDVPRRNVENAKAFAERGLTRYVLPPRALVTVSGRLPVAVLETATDYEPLRFSRGRLHLALPSDPSATPPLSLAETAELLTEMVAALAYHYDANTGGGTAIADVFVNDGDFVARRRSDGSFDLRLTAARFLESGIGPDLLLSYLIQWAAYDPWTLEGRVVGIPSLMSNPSIAFEGLERGRRYRHADLDSPEERGTEEARQWIADLWRTPHGRAYRPWAEQFLGGRLPVRFGDDLREHWWQLAPLRQRRDLLVLRERRGIDSDAAAARELEAFVQERASEIGRRPQDAAPRVIANAEIYGDVAIPPSAYGAAVDLLPSFADYMDAVLHDREWGYYGHHVEIGARGHFNTHPEILSPHYGQWLATLALGTWRDLVARGDTSERDCFYVVEFGAGNGRLAKDFLDSVSRAARDAEGDAHTQWSRFEQCLSYCVYEMSESLRQKQAALLGDDALVRPGDARRPVEALRQHHPDGVVGMVLSNEVADTFGVHKVAFTRDGGARAALVLPRVEATLLSSLDDTLVSRVKAANTKVRAALQLHDHAEDAYLDADTWQTLMRSLPSSQGDREEQLSMLWFEEVYVPASEVPDLAEHLEANAEQYAIALAAEGDGVVQYVGLHACRFIRGIAASMSAGIVVTVDYGDSTWGLVEGARRGDFRLRVYGDASQPFVPRTNDPYAAAGTQDITTDVNFTDLAHAGESADLHVVHYGAEIDLARDDLADVLRAGDEAPYSALFEPDVKVLVLGTHPSDLLIPVGTPQPLRHGQDRIPPERRGEIARWTDMLRASGQNTATPPNP